MIPGLPQEMLQGSDEEGSLRMKRMIYITDSMTAAELDSDGSLFMEHGKDGKPTGLTWRVTRVARGSGTSVREVEELLCQYRMMANMAKQAGGKNGWYVYDLLWNNDKSDLSFSGSRQYRRCKVLQVVRGEALAECQRLLRFRQCRCVDISPSYHRPQWDLVIFFSVRCLLACCSKCSGKCAVAAVCRK